MILLFFGMSFTVLVLIILLNPYFWKGYRNSKFIDEYLMDEKNHQKKERLQNYTAEYYSKFSASPENFMIHKDYCKHYGRMVGIIIACLAVFCLMFSLP